MEKDSDSLKDIKQKSHLKISSSITLEDLFLKNIEYEIALLKYIYIRKKMNLYMIKSGYMYSVATKVLVKRRLKLTGKMEIQDDSYVAKIRKQKMREINNFNPGLIF